jgi:ketosteroid isomerase-like protein
VIDRDVQELLRLNDEAQLAWVNGTVHPLFDLSRGTIFGPFGGPAMGGPDIGPGQAAMAAKFHDGTVEIERVQTIVSGDVVTLVSVEHNTARFEDDPEPRRWTLRTTMLFRRDPDGWTLLHRHADPLIDRRDLAATLELQPRRP